MTILEVGRRAALDALRRWFALRFNGFLPDGQITCPRCEVEICGFLRAQTNLLKQFKPMHCPVLQRKIFR
jgi:hypothetical protein